MLLCRRAIEPRHGLWTLPAGFLENGETVAAGAVRETLEEASARVEVGELYTMISLPQISQIYMMFRARLVDLDFGPGPESLEVRLFHEDEIPWEEMAFRTIGRTLRNYFLDRKLGSVPDARQRARAQGAAAGPVRRRLRPRVGAGFRVEFAAHRVAATRRGARGHRRPAATIPLWRTSMQTLHTPLARLAAVAAAVAAFALALPALAQQHEPDLDHDRRHRRRLLPDGRRHGQHPVEVRPRPARRPPK